MSDNDNNNSSDDQNEVDPQKHKLLLQSISRLGKNQHIQKPSRTEPVLEQDEFHLSKTGRISQVKTKDTTVSVKDLVKILNKSNEHSNVGKELTTTQWSNKVLPKPLEKPEADRIQRSIGYEKTKNKLKRWDAVVSRNRQSDHQVFPLDYEEIHVDTTRISKKKPLNFSIKSDLQLEMEALEEKYKLLKGIKTDNVDENEKKIQQKLTRNELIAKRKELAYLRMQQSQKSAKARLHNKIKSKKFHKLLKKEKLKEQLKNFELLQKTNPEAALEELEKIEKSRVMERANLRHKNTGTWAKNLQIRAKYDREVRKDLAEQLAISRELTQKREQESDDDNKNYNNNESDAEMNEENVNDESESVDPFNPWVKVTKKKNKNDTIDEVLVGYKQYWLERNKNEKATQEYKAQLQANHLGKNQSDENIENNGSNIDKKISVELKDHIKIQNQNLNGLEKSTTPKDKIKKSKPVILRNNNISKRPKPKMENGWIVEEINTSANGHHEGAGLENQDYHENSKSKLMSKDIDDIFDEAEDNMQEKISKKMRKVKDFLRDMDNTNNKFKSKSGKTAEKDELENLKNLSFKNQNQRPDFDEELYESPMKEKSAVNISNSNKEFGNNKLETKKTETEQNIVDQIDPNDFADIKPKRLHSLIAADNPYYEFDEEINEDNYIDPELNRQMTIAEAFEDDDVVADFQKEKEDKNKQDNELDLTMPGWGSWAGCGISNQKKKRLVLKFPEKEKRRDDNKGNLFINENVNDEMKKHLVSDLPFPFTSVKDYEASIRAPIGRSFVPETAFRILTRPAVETKLGHVIQPMNESILVKKPFFKRKHVVDQKIGKMLKTEEKKSKLKT